jgi:hypothetical protein
VAVPGLDVVASTISTVARWNTSTWRWPIARLAALLEGGGMRARSFTHGLAVLAALASFAGLHAGCGGGGGGGSASAASAVTSGTSASSTSGTTGATSSSTSGAATSGSTASGTTPAPGGPDTSPPVITLTSPTRGLFTTQPLVRVEGTVVDQTGVAYLVVNGTPVLPAAGGAFLQVVPLTPGLNVIELEAADPLGHRTRTVLPVVSGQFTPEVQPIGDALAVRLNRPAFAAIERLAAQQLGGASLGQMIMAQNPLYQGNFTVADVQVNATSATFGQPALTLDPQQGGLRVHVELPSIDVRTRVTGHVLGIPLGVNVSVTADRAIVDATAVVSVAPGGVVTTTLQNVAVSLVNFRFDIGGIPTFIENLARAAVQRLVEAQVRRQVEQVVPQQVDQAIAGANGPITQTVLGHQVTLRLIPTLVTFDPQGCEVRCDGDLTAAPAPGLPTTPGSLSTPGAPPTFGTTPAVHLSLNDDMLNRIGHTAWRAGLMGLHIDQTAAQQLGLPSWLPLDVFMLQVFFPQLVGHVNPLDPLELDISSATPALFRTLPAGQGLLEAGIGDLTVSIYAAPAGRPRQLLLRAGTQVRVGVQPNMANNVVTLSVVGRPTIRTDVFETPVVPLDEVAVENFLDFVLPPVVQVLPRVWQGFPLPVYPGLNPSNLQAVPDGPQGDFVTVRGDL